MKLCIVAALFAFLAVAYGRPEEKYTTRFDNVDVDQVLRSDRLLKNYTNCLLDKGKCGPDAAELKRLLPDALKSGCSKCSDKQKAGTRKMVRYLLTNKRDLWNTLEAKYDPGHIYVTKYADELKKEGIVL